MADDLKACADRRRLRVLDDVQIETLPDPEWLCHGLIPAGRLSLMYGPPGEGKSFLALHLAMCAATGLDWLGIKVKHGPVVYVAAEGQAGLKLRVAAWKFWHSKKGLLGVYFVVEPVQMLEREGLDEFLKLLAVTKPVLVVIDTLARCLLNGEEDSAKDMGQFVAAVDEVVRETAAAVLILHHPTKDGKRERGSGALRGAVDTVLQVRQRKGANGVVEIRCEKQKDSDLAEPLTATLEQVTLPSGGHSCVVLTTTDSEASLSATPARRPLTKRHREMLAALSGLSDHRGGATDWIVALRSSGVPLPERTFYRYAEELTAAGHVTKEGTGRAAAYTLTSSGSCQCQMTAN